MVDWPRLAIHTLHNCQISRYNGQEIPVCALSGNWSSFLVSALLTLRELRKMRKVCVIWHSQSDHSWRKVVGEHTVLFTLWCKCHVLLPHACSPAEPDKSDSSRLVQAWSATRELASLWYTLGKHNFLAKQRNPSLLYQLKCVYPSVFVLFCFNYYSSVDFVCYMKMGSVKSELVWTVVKIMEVVLS